MTFVGLDLHKRYITACALTPDGVIAAEAKRLPAARDALLAFLAPLPGPITLAMEATLYWAWLAERLEATGFAVQVAHAYQVKLIGQARSKTDPIDARKLAELLRTHLLPTIWVADAATRARRQLLRGRAFLVRQRTQLKNRIHGHLTAENHVCPTTDLYGTAGRTWLTSVALSPALRQQVDVLRRLVDTLTQEIHAHDQLVKRAARGNAIATQLQTLPGVGPFGALMLEAEIVQTLKLAPGPVGAYYQRLLRAKGKGKGKATVAAARKLCCYRYWMLKEGWSYAEWLEQHDRSPSSEVRPVQRMGAVA